MIAWKIMPLPGLKLSVAAASSARSKFRQDGFFVAGSNPQSIPSSALRFLASVFLYPLLEPLSWILRDAMVVDSLRADFLFSASITLRQCRPWAWVAGSRTSGSARCVASSFSTEDDELKLLLWSESRPPTGTSSTPLGEQDSSFSCPFSGPSSGICRVSFITAGDIESQGIKRMKNRELGRSRYECVK